MHEYRQFVQRMLDEKGWKQSDVERHGGPSRQVMSAILRDKRPSLSQRPDQETIQGLATAFGVDVEKVLASVAAAMGLPTAVTVAGLEAASNEELLDEIRRRMESTSEQQDYGDFSGRTKEGRTYNQDGVHEPRRNSLQEREVREREARLVAEQEQGSGAAPREEQKTQAPGLPAGIDFDLAAHPDMKMAADRTDEHFDQAGEEDQDTEGRP